MKAGDLSYVFETHSVVQHDLASGIRFTLFWGYSLQTPKFSLIIH